MLVAILTENQKDSLVGQLVATDWYFNPIEEMGGNWVISQQEIDGSIYPDHQWIKDLQLTEWTGPYIPISGTTGYVGS
jgi:hypothetical protein